MRRNKYAEIACEPRRVEWVVAFVPARMAGFRGYTPPWFCYTIGISA
jgi:hypothetical protein